MSRILMVTPYAPHRDGIAVYAVQSVAALRREGHDVEVLSPGPSAAHHHLDLADPRGALALAKRVRGYDRVVVQFHPEMFYPVPPKASELPGRHAGLLAAFAACRHLEVRLHEIDYRWGRGHGAGPVLARQVWRRPDRVVVHTDVQRREFLSAFGGRPSRVEVTAHGADFVPRTRATREQARRTLGIDEGATVFLAIGFIQPHKGFDRAVRAFAGLDARGARLDVVGSVRVEEPAWMAHLSELAALVEATPGAHLHEEFVSDERFDRWIVASDVVVLPYRHIWSSGVMERAALYGRRVIASDVGGLAQQAAGHAGVTLVGDDAELATALWAATGGAAPVVALRPWGEMPGAGLAAEVQAEVVVRAAARRGGAARRPARPADGAGTSAARAAADSASLSVPVRRLAPLAVPQATSARLVSRVLKRVVWRLAAWLVEPLTWQVNALREATIAALERAPLAPPGDLPDHTDAGR